jgi:hypothetical protein
LVDKLGVEVRSEYSNDMRCAEYVSHIAEMPRKDLICELKIQKYVTLLLNASTDKASVEDLTLYVRYITDNKVEVFYQSSLSNVLLQMDIFKLFNRNWKSLDSTGFLLVNLLELVQMEQPA